MNNIKDISGIALWQAYCDKKEEVEIQQDRITALEKIVADQERRLEDNVRLTKFVDKANSELSTENNDLKAQVDHWKSNHDNVVEKLRHFTRRPDLTINKQQEEIKALKAQAEKLTTSMKLVLDNNGFKCSIVDMKKVLDKTPQQCLAEIRVSAVEDAIKFMQRNNLKQITSLITYTQLLRKDIKWTQ